MKHAIITGSSRGIGFGLATEFLKRNFTITVSGTTEKSTLKAKEELIKLFDENKIHACKCDVRNFDDIKNLWNTTFDKFKRVDIWINNAGIGQENKYFAEIENSKIEDLIDINIKGMMFGSKFAFKKMAEQGFGAIYNMEGFGSDGRKMKKLSLYGTSKIALNYFTETFIKETIDAPVIVGLISPGMVVTDLLMSPINNNSEDRKQFEKIANILADKVETVTPYLTENMIKNTKHGKAIRWLTTGKIIARFTSSLFRKRKII